MLSDELKEQIKCEIETIGYNLWGIESHTTDNKNVIQIFVDKPDGISLDECKEVSKQIGTFLDVEDAITTKYVLEVSSPGINRKIYYIEQLIGLEENDFKIKLQVSVNGRKAFKAKLKYVDINSKTLTFEYESQQLVVDFNNLDKINLSYKW